MQLNCMLIAYIKYEDLTKQNHYKDCVTREMCFPGPALISTDLVLLGHPFEFSEEF